MKARTLMVQGTASSVGKSVMVAALCRIFRQRGLRVAPFKSQNMALNSFVAADGGEIGRAQAVQAEAAGIAPMVEMNPILLKPEGGMRSQVVLMGRPLGSMSFAEYHRHKPELCQIIAECLEILRARYELVIIEGAGSPAEINLNSYDIVNMHVAEVAGAPVLLLGDIDRGGVFAQMVGTMELLAPAHRARIAAFLINKFRGDPQLLGPGLEFLARRYHIPVLGVIPYIERLRIAEEDSAALDQRPRHAAAPGTVDIAIVRLPHIANYDDFMPLEHEPGVTVRYLAEPHQLANADLVIIPGSKSTVNDLQWLRRTGFADFILRRAEHRQPLLGICGGCQMLGEAITDPQQIESAIMQAPGMGLLPLRTRFTPDKLTAQVRARLATRSLLGEAGAEITGYEIHMGRIALARPVAPLFRLLSRNGVAIDLAEGAVTGDGLIIGTMLHGIFENDGLRHAMLSMLRERRGLPTPLSGSVPMAGEAEYDRLAAAVAGNIDMAKLVEIIGLGQCGAQ